MPVSIPRPHLPHKALSVILLCIACCCSRPQLAQPPAPYGTWEPELDHPWVDSVYQSMTEDERIAQLMMVAAYSNRDEAHIKEIAALVSQYKIGGLIFFQGGPVRQARMTNRFQAISKVPLLIAIDGEWGLSMRLDSVPLYPRQMMLGAVQDRQLIYRFGQEVARQCRRIGIHLNFAPVVDINTNPQNPVINNRAFGDDKQDISERALMYMEGMQSARLLTSAKHFPGHGDTEVDSHLGLPTVLQSYEQLDDISLYPYKYLIDRNLTGIMVAHLHVPALDDAPGSIASVSERIVSGLLRDSLHFKGLVYTDAMNMKGLSNSYRSDEACVAALQAGADILVMPDDVPAAIRRIKTAVETGQLAPERIESACKRVLYAKVWSGAYRQKPIETARLTEDLNDGTADMMARALAEAGLTVLQNRRGTLPLGRLDGGKTAVVLQGVSRPNTFLRSLARYQETDVYYFNRNSSEQETAKLLRTLSRYDLVITGIHDTNYRPADRYGVTPQEIAFTDRLADSTQTILAFFGIPYALNGFRNLSSCAAVILAYQDQALIQDYTAQLIYGAIGANGRLPVNLLPYQAGTGLDLPGGLRLKYSTPDEVHARPQPLRSIDSLVAAAIRQKIMPGCQIVAAKDGVVFLNKCYGAFTYDKSAHQVAENDLYDLASVTKIAASVPALMQLEDASQLNVEHPVSTYWPALRETGKSNITFVEMLSHIARLQPYINFYFNTLTTPDGDGALFRYGKDQTHTIPIGSNAYLHKQVGYKDGYYTRTPDSLHHVQVADRLYIRDDFRDSIFAMIDASSLLTARAYKYSDLGYYYIWRVIERLTGEKMQDYLQRTLYTPLGASTMGYLPLQRFPAGRIAPTENDTYFRRQLLQGYVHDQGAAMLGGVCGHAGLFASANDLAKLMQTYLNKGIYGGVRYFSEDRIDYYTSAHFADLGNRRGVGFDRPLKEYSPAGPVCDGVSQQSFGHSGFTGTYTWADPESGLLFVFTTNRLYPNETENQLAKQDIRTRIHRWLIDAVSE